MMPQNTALYCQVDAGTVVVTQRKLNQNEKDVNGAWHYNVNDTNLYDNDRLRTEVDFYPYLLIDSGPPGPSGYTRTLDPYVITATHVTQTAIYTQIPIDDLRKQKAGELERQVTQYSANQVAADNLIANNVRSQIGWVETKTIELLALTDWQSVADFDTQMPDVLPISNTTQGASYVEQGLVMQTQNDSAENAGLAAPWDKTKLASHISSNEQAAKDATGATPVVHPDFSLRQGSVTPADRFSNLLIYRSMRQYDGRPSPDPSVEMALFHKEDTRPLYCFLYLQAGTYLEWIEFTHWANGTWRANSSVNVLSWVNSDMKFIFSYGTNPAVQQDYFTNEILFDAGSVPLTLRIRWDTE